MALTLYRNGSVYSAADPLASAMLVDGNTVAWVGGEHAATSVYDSSMRLVDLRGALITPGFVDSHVHLTETGVALESLDLGAAKSLQALLEQVAGAVRSPGVLLGFGWDETAWPEGRPPTAEELDRAGSGAEIYLARVDVHSAVVSSSLARRLELPGLPGWRPDGVVTGEAHRIVRDAVRDFDSATRERYQTAALRAAAASGHVAVAEMAIPGAGALADLGRLMQRSASEPGYPEVLPYWAQAISSAEQGREVLRELAEHGVRPRGLGGDLNVDGSIGSRTARLRAEYADLPGHRGTLSLDEERIAEHLAACSELGLSGGFHIIGDAGMDAAVAGLRRAAETVGAAAVRAAGHRFEHAEMIDQAAIAALAEFSVTASLQPAFDALWGGPGGLYEARLGAGRSGRMNPVAELFAAGVPVCLGSDSPVTPFDPWAGVKACLAHHQPAQRISARAAFLGYSRAGWRAAKEQDPMIGQLVPGAPASFAVWQVDELMVQVADERVQSWSTDPRSRTPLLPALDTENAPQCLLTVHRGEELYATAEADF